MQLRPIYFTDGRGDDLVHALALIESLLAHGGAEPRIVVLADETGARAIEAMPVPQVEAAEGDPNEVLGLLVAEAERVVWVPPRCFAVGPLEASEAAPASPSAPAVLQLGGSPHGLLGVVSPDEVGSVTSGEGMRITRRGEARSEPLRVIDFSHGGAVGTDMFVPDARPDRRWGAAMLPLVARYADAVVRAAAWLRATVGIGAPTTVDWHLETSFLATRRLASLVDQRALPHQRREGPGWAVYDRGQIELSAAADWPPHAAPVPPATAIDGPLTDGVVVSALVSTYRASRFLPGCLDDLVAQSAFARGELEIVVVDSASPEDEASIVRDYQRRYPNIRYLRSPQREGVYMAWNRAAALARGRYLTNANTDDRHHPEFMDRLADALDADPSLGLVYADSLVTKTPGPWGEVDVIAQLGWPSYRREQLLHGCHVGPHPMWRRAVHDVVGWFDPRYRVAGDYDMWMRIAERFPLEHVDRPLGLYLDADDSVESKNQERCARETSAARELYAARAGVELSPGRYPDTYVRAPDAPMSAAAPPRDTGREAPRIFSIETVLACDLRCPECAIGGDRIDGRKRRVMKMEDFRILADKIRPYADYVNLHIWGEPMLNKDVFDIIAYTSTFAATNISTNGQSMTADKAERLIASGVRDVIVSIDGFSQEVYEQYRVGGDAVQARKALMWLQRARLRQRRPVNIMPQFIVFEHNEHEMEAFAEFCRSIGLEPTFKAPYLDQAEPGRFRPPSDPGFRRPAYDSLEAQREAMRGCRDPQEVFTVMSDGSVVICCHDANATTTFGNLFEQDVLEIWNDPAYRAYRGAVLGGQAPSFCTESCVSYPRASRPEPGLITRDQLLRRVSP